MNNRPEIDRCALIEAGFYAFAICVAAVIVWIVALAPHMTALTNRFTL